MFSIESEELMRPCHAGIITAIKRSDGLSVADIARELGRSYMGIKQHCISLENKGFLSAWRVPRKQVGRPEKLYQLTDKCEALFPNQGPIVLTILDASRELLGEAGPEKLLGNHFEQRQKEWAAQIKATEPEQRVSQLVETLQGEGYFLHTKVDDSLSINVYHHPLKEVIIQYPSIVEMEIQALQQATELKTEREEVKTDKGQKQIIYHFRP